MDLQVEMSISDDGQIHLIFRGQAQGVADFRDVNVFAAFVEECYEWIESCKRSAMTETPIPEAFLRAFDDDGGV